MLDSNKQAFLSLTRLGVGVGILNNPGRIDWDCIKSTATEQGLSGVVLDGIDCLSEQEHPRQEVLLQWIGEVLQDESLFSLQKDVAVDAAKLFYRNGIKMYVLKGMVVSECYPKPNHRVSTDIDCYLLPESSEFDAWSLGNDLIRSKGFKVNTDFYKNSSFEISGVLVENHQFLTPFRGNKRLKFFENVLQSYLKSDKGLDIIKGTHLYRPPVMMTALFLVEHAYSHFLHEGLTWRHVLDWMMFSKKHHKEIFWSEFDSLIDESGFRRFYDSYMQLGRFLYGEIEEAELTKNDKRLMDDVWAPLDFHETDQGLRGKLNLVGNTLRAWWKYHYFAEISMPHALWIQAYGVLFDKNPKLN